MSNTRRPRGAYPARQQSTPRSTQVVVGVIALLCVAAVIALAFVLNGNGSSPAAAGPTTPASSSAPPSGMDCTPAPALPTKPLSFKQAPSRSLAQKSTWDATITTNCGVIDVRLDGAQAPQTVSSFLFLAKKGYFDNTPCHRLTTGGLYLLQCGDPTGTGGGSPGYGFGIENAPKDGDFPTGTVAMARANSPASNGSQFFIVYEDTKLPTTGGGYSIFAKVTKGLDIVKALARAGVTGGGTDGAPTQPISILNVAVKKA